VEEINSRKKLVLGLTAITFENSPRKSRCVELIRQLEKDIDVLALDQEFSFFYHFLTLLLHIPLVY
jgi:hypothetical protein